MASNSQIAFSPLGNTIVVAAAAVAPTGLQAPVFAKFNGLSTGQYRVVNSGAVTVFLGAGSTAAEAATNATAPVAGTPSAAIVLLPGAIEILRFATGTFFSGSASVAATVFIVPGQGI